MKRAIYFVLLALLMLPAHAQLKLVPESFKQISNLDAANPKEWGDIDAHLLKREDKTDENGVNNALLKLNIDKISKEDMADLEFICDQGVFVKWIQQDNTPGQMWLLVTGIQTSFKAVHPIFGESNSLVLDLKGLCSYTLNLTNNETTTLTILSEPEGANIYLDGQWMGNATNKGCILKQVSFGKHTLRAELDNVVDHLDIDVSEASQRSYKLEVYKKRDFTIHSDPKGATVYVDGEQVGVAPITLPLKLKYHLIEAKMGEQYDRFEAKFDEKTANTINLNVVKHKKVQVAAIRAGREISANVHVDNQFAGTTPHTVDLPYGSHELLVSYGAKTKKKSVKVSDKSPTYYRFKFSTKNSFTWPWEKDYQVRPVGLSVGFVEKTWVMKSTESGTENIADVKTDFFGDGKFIPGIQAGLRVQPQFKYGFGLNTGLFYEYYWDKGEMVDADNSSIYYAGKYQEHSIYLPIDLEYRITLAENVSLFINGGLGMDIGIAGSITAKDDGDDEPFFEETAIYDNSEFNTPKRFNLSYEFGGGFQIYGVQVSFNVAKGLLEHSNMEGISMKVNKPMMIAVSYVFSGK